MHPKQTPSHLDSNKEKKIVHLFLQGGRAGGSSVSILGKNHIKNKLVTTITTGEYTGIRENPGESGRIGKPSY